MKQASLAIALACAPCGIATAQAPLAWHIGKRPIAAFGNSDGDLQMDKALDEAKANNWLVVSMKSNWKKIFAFEH